MMQTHWFRTRSADMTLTFGVEAEGQQVARRRLKNDDPCWLAGDYLGTTEPPRKTGEIRAVWPWRDTTNDVDREWPDYMRSDG